MNAGPGVAHADTGSGVLRAHGPTQHKVRANAVRSAIDAEEGRWADVGSSGVGDQGEGGEVRALLTVLEARGLPVDAATRERVDPCLDTGLLTRWIARAVTASGLAEVFGD